LFYIYIYIYIQIWIHIYIHKLSNMENVFQFFGKYGSKLEKFSESHISVVSNNFAVNTQVQAISSICIFIAS